MVLINRAAHPYRYFLRVTSTRSFTGSTPLVAFAAGSSYGTWGLPYDDTDVTGHGWKIEFTTKLDHGVESYFGVLRIPGLSLTHNFSGAGWLTDLNDAHLVFQNLKLTVTGCDSWEVSWDSFEFFVLGVSDYSDATPRTFSGTGFSPDNNTNYGFTSTSTDLLGEPLPGCISCPGGPPWTFAGYDLSVTCDADFGWDHAPDGSTFVEEPCDLVATYPPPSVACDCSMGLLVPYLDALHTCRHVHAPADARRTSTKTYIGNIECECWDGSNHATYPVYLYEELYYAHTSKAWADPIANTSRKYKDDSGARCWASGGAPAYTTATTGNVISTHAMARWYADVARVLNNGVCPEGDTSPPVCPPPVHEGDPEGFTCTGLPGCEGCAYEAYSGRSWVDTTCQETTGTQVADDRHSDWGHTRAFVDAGTIHVGLRENPHGSGWVDVDTSISGTNPDVRWSRTQSEKRLWLWYEHSGAIYERYSLNDPSGFSMATTITSSGSPNNPRGVPDISGNRLVYWRDGTDVKGVRRDRQGNTLDSVFTAISGVDSGSAISARDYVDGQGVWRIDMQVIIGGALVEYTSIDGKTFT